MALVEDHDVIQTLAANLTNHALDVSDIHTVGRNASKTTSATFLVFLLKDKNALVLIPVK
jgi:hypothetical protein